MADEIEQEFHKRLAGASQEIAMEIIAALKAGMDKRVGVLCTDETQMRCALGCMALAYANVRAAAGTIFTEAHIVKIEKMVEAIPTGAFLVPSTDVKQ